MAPSLLHFSELRTWRPRKTRLREVEIPLPPLAEQRRIVARVDELMPKVDALEAQISAASTTATRLLDAIVAELTSPATVRTDTNTAVLQNKNRPLRKAIRHKLTPPRTSLS